MKVSKLSLISFMVVALSLMLLPVLVQAHTCNPSCLAPKNSTDAADAVAIFSQQCAQCTRCPDHVQTCPTYYLGTGQPPKPVLVLISRFEIDYLGSSINGNEVTFSYKVTNLGSGYAYPGLSHFVLGLGQITCLADGLNINQLVTKCYIGTTQVPCEIGTPSNPDPTTQLYGEKLTQDDMVVHIPYHLPLTSQSLPQTGILMLVAQQW